MNVLSFSRCVIRKMQFGKEKFTRRSMDGFVGPCRGWGGVTAPRVFGELVGPRKGSSTAPGKNVALQISFSQVDACTYKKESWQRCYEFRLTY